MFNQVEVVMCELDTRAFDVISPYRAPWLPCSSKMACVSVCAYVQPFSTCPAAVSAI